MVQQSLCEHCHHPVATHRAWLRAAVWASLSFLGLWVLLAGHTDLYIAPNIDWTLELAVPVALSMTIIDGYSAWQNAVTIKHLPALLKDIPHASLAELFQGILFLPFLLGCSIGPSVLNARSLANNDSVISYVAAPSQMQIASASVQPQQFNLLQLRDHMSNHLVPVDTQIATTGFIYNLQNLPNGDVLLVRFITLHCMAEAQPIAIVMHVSSTMHIPANNTWVHVTGRITAGSAQGQSVAVMNITTLQMIAQPRDPYLIY